MRVEKTLYGLSDCVQHFVRDCFAQHKTSTQMYAVFHNVKLPQWLTNTKGKDRYPKYYRVALEQVFYAVQSALESRDTVFGYFYMGEFYTTHKQGTKHKTTQVLHDMRLPQSVWDAMPRGVYYEDNLKPYYIEKGES